MCLWCDTHTHRQQEKAMPRAPKKPNSTAEFRASVVQDWKTSSQGTSLRAYAKIRGVNESTLRAWIKRYDAVSTAGGNEIYIRQNSSPTMDWIKSCIQENNPPTRDAVLMHVASHSPQSIANKSYDARRRVVDRLLQNANREVNGFVHVSHNVALKCQSTSQEVAALVPVSREKCGCKRWCGARCANRLTYQECTDEVCSTLSTCTNRALQLGIEQPILVKPTRNTGEGVFAASAIRKGMYIGEFAGEIINDETRDARKRVGRGKYVMELDNGVFLDAMHVGTALRMCNHSCRPNCRAELWHVSSEPRIAIYCLRPIDEGEEITIMYGKEYDLGELCFCDHCRKNI